MTLRGYKITIYCTRKPPRHPRWHLLIIGGIWRPWYRAGRSPWAPVHYRGYHTIIPYNDAILKLLQCHGQWFVCGLEVLVFTSQAFLLLLQLLKCNIAKWVGSGPRGTLSPNSWNSDEGKDIDLFRYYSPGPYVGDLFLVIALGGKLNQGSLILVVKHLNIPYIAFVPFLNLQHKLFLPGGAPFGIISTRNDRLFWCDWHIASYSKRYFHPMSWGFQSLTHGLPLFSQSGYVG